MPDVCTGTFILHRAELMQGYRACVSWFYHEDFLERFDGLKPVSDRIFVVDRDRLTCSGGVSSAHLAAFIVERHPQTWPQPLGDAVDEEIDDVVLGQIAAREPLVLRPQPLSDLAHRRDDGNHDGKPRRHGVPPCHSHYETWAQNCFCRSSAMGRVEADRKADFGVVEGSGIRHSAAGETGGRIARTLDASPPERNFVLEARRIAAAFRA